MFKMSYLEVEKKSTLKHSASKANVTRTI